MDRKRQGDLGVAAAIWHYTKAGYVVSVPATDAARYDLVVDNGTLHRVQCKTTGFKSPHGVYVVQLATKGGNRSGIGIKKCIDEDECDLVFIYRMDGIMYEIPSSVAQGRTTLNLGKLCDEYKI